MTANIALCEQVMDKIRTYPEQHNQRRWAVRTDCGTTRCFAGWAVTLAGWRLRFRVCVHAPECAHACTDSDGITLPIHHVAQEVLGLTPREATALFCEDNTVDDLEAMVKNLANGKEITWGLWGP